MNFLQYALQEARKRYGFEPVADNRLPSVDVVAQSAGASPDEVLRLQDEMRTRPPGSFAEPGLQYDDMGLVNLGLDAAALAPAVRGGLQMAPRFADAAMQPARNIAQGFRALRDPASEPGLFALGAMAGKETPVLTRGFRNTFAGVEQPALSSAQQAAKKSAVGATARAAERQAPVLAELDMAKQAAKEASQKAALRQSERQGAAFSKVQNAPADQLAQQAQAAGLPLKDYMQMLGLPNELPINQIVKQSAQASNVAPKVAIPIGSLTGREMLTSAGRLLTSPGVKAAGGAAALYGIGDNLLDLTANAVDAASTPEEIAAATVAPQNNLPAGQEQSIYQDDLGIGSVGDFNALPADMSQMGFGTQTRQQAPQVQSAARPDRSSLRRDTTSASQRIADALSGRQQEIENRKFVDERSFGDKLAASLAAFAAGYRGDIQGARSFDPRYQFEQQRKQDLQRANMSADEIALAQAMSELNRDSTFNDRLDLMDASGQLSDEEAIRLKAELSQQGRAPQQERLDPLLEQVLELYKAGAIDANVAAPYLQMVGLTPSDAYIQSRRKTDDGTNEMLMQLIAQRLGQRGAPATAAPSTGGRDINNLALD